MTGLHENVLNGILDKISLRGLEGLTKREKEILIKISKGEDFIKINTGNLALDEVVSDALSYFKIATFKKVNDKFDTDNYLYFILFSNEEQLIIKNYNNKKLDLSEIFGETAGSFYAYLKKDVMNKLGIPNAIKFLDVLADYYNDKTFSE